MKQIDYSDLINLTKASRFLGVSRMTIHRWIKSGKLKTHRIGGMPYVALRDLRKIKEQREVNKPTD